MNVVIVGAKVKESGPTIYAAAGRSRSGDDWIVWDIERDKYVGAADKAYDEHQMQHVNVGGFNDVVHSVSGITQGQPGADSEFFAHQLVVYLDALEILY